MSSLILVIPVGRDFRLLDRALTHYRKLGVEKIFLNVHARPDWGVDLTDRIQQIAEQHDARIGHVHCQRYIESHQTTRVILDHYAKRDDWIVYSDLDEFHEYPLPIPEIIKLCKQQRYDYVKGRLLDRLAENGTLPMLNDRPLHRLFPAGAQITPVIRGGSPDKIVLARASLMLGPGQHFVEDKEARCAPAIDVVVHHYRWDAETRANMNYWLEMLNNFGVDWKIEHERLLTHLDQHGDRFDLSDPALMTHYPAAPVSSDIDVVPHSGNSAQKINGDSVLCQIDGDRLEAVSENAYSLRRNGSSLTQLNTSAATLWAVCDGERCINDIVTELANEYGFQRSAVKRDALMALRSMATQQLLRVLPVNRGSNYLAWDELPQSQFLQGLSLNTHPQLYQDIDLCHGLLTQIKVTEHAYKSRIHYYWRQSGAEFGDKQVAALTACLASQNLEQVEVIFWYADEDPPGCSAFDVLLSSGYIQLRKYDPQALAIGSPLQGQLELLSSRDDQCYLDGDLFRLLVLFRFGGVYVDMDVMLLRDLSPLLSFEFMYAWGSKHQGHINGAVMHFFPGSAAIHKMLSLLMEVEIRPGTTAFGAEIYHLARKHHEFTVLPYGFFNPEWTRFENPEHEYAEKPDTFMQKNSRSLNIYLSAFAWHWHNKWGQEIESGSKFSVLAALTQQRWRDKQKFLHYIGA